MILWFESLSGANFPVEVGDVVGTLQELKENVHKALDIPIRRQLLSFKGNILREDTDLLGVYPGSTIKFRILPPLSQQPISAALPVMEGPPLPDLPHDIIAKIQSQLCERDGALSCHLSKAWNRAWLSRPNIILEESNFEVREHFLDYVDKIIESHRTTTALKNLVCDVIVERFSTAEAVAAKYLKEKSSNIRITFTGDFTADIPPVRRVLFNADWAFYLSTLYLNNVCLEHFENIDCCKVLKSLSLVDCRRSNFRVRDFTTSVIKIRSASIESVDVCFTKQQIYNVASQNYTSLFTLPSLREFKYYGFDYLNPSSFEAGIEGCQTYINLDMEGSRFRFALKDLWIHLKEFRRSNITLSLCIWRVSEAFGASIPPPPQYKSRVELMRVKLIDSKSGWEILDTVFDFVRPNCIAVELESAHLVLKTLYDYVAIESVDVQLLDEEVRFDLQW